MRTYQLLSSGFLDSLLNMHSHLMSYCFFRMYTPTGAVVFVSRMHLLVTSVDSACMYAPLNVDVSHLLAHSLLASCSLRTHVQFSECYCLSFMHTESPDRMMSVHACISPWPFVPLCCVLVQCNYLFCLSSTCAFPSLRLLFLVGMCTLIPVKSLLHACSFLSLWFFVFLARIHFNHSYSLSFVCVDTYLSCVVCFLERMCTDMTSIVSLLGLRKYFLLLICTLLLVVSLLCAHAYTYRCRLFSYTHLLGYSFLLGHSLNYENTLFPRTRISSTFVFSLYVCVCVFHMRRPSLVYVNVHYPDWCRLSCGSTCTVA